LESFALETQNQQAKQMYHQIGQQVSQIVSQLESRVNTMEQEEPTYKISSSTQSGSQNQQMSGPMMSATNVTGKNQRTR
jgi:hypothetical protein